MEVKLVFNTDFMVINYSETLTAERLRQFLLNKVVVDFQLSVVLEM